MSALIELRSYLFRYRVAIIGGFLFLILANIVALGLVQAVLSFFGRYIQADISRRIEYELRGNLFKHFEKLELDYFQHNKVGDLVARATNDLTAVRSLLGPGISNLMNTVVAF